MDKSTPRNLQMSLVWSLDLWLMCYTRVWSVMRSLPSNKRNFTFIYIILYYIILYYIILYYIILYYIILYYIILYYIILYYIILYYIILYYIILYYIILYYIILYYIILYYIILYYIILYYIILYYIILYYIILYYIILYYIILYYIILYYIILYYIILYYIIYIILYYIILYQAVIRLTWVSGLWLGKRHRRIVWAVLAACYWHCKKVWSVLLRGQRRDKHTSTLFCCPFWPHRSVCSTYPETSNCWVWVLVSPKVGGCAIRLLKRIFLWEMGDDFQAIRTGNSWV